MQQVDSKSGPSLGLDEDLGGLLDHVFRREYGRILASLVSSFADFDLAEDALVEALEDAARTWPRDRVPERAGARLLTFARRRAVDRIRRNRDVALDSTTLDGLWAPTLLEDEGYPDERLKLMFLCTHPTLPMEDRVALTLHSLGGLTTGEIASALVVPVQILAQRLVRAKRKIQEAALKFEVPPVDRIGERIEGVMAVVYLIFTEGFAASGGKRVPHGELCAEAVALGRTLVDLVGSGRVAISAKDRSEVTALLALMLLQLGGTAAIVEGRPLLETSQSMARTGFYQLQAAVALLLAEGETSGTTKWNQIVVLYRNLLQWSPGPVVLLHYAVALGHVSGPSTALEHLEPLDDALENYGPYHWARAELLAHAKRYSEARRTYRNCLQLTRNAAERRAILERLGSLPTPEPDGV